MEYDVIDAVAVEQSVVCRKSPDPVDRDAARGDVTNG